MSGKRSILSGTNLFRFSWCQVHLAWRSAQRAREVSEGGGRGRWGDSWTGSCLVFKGEAWEHRVRSGAVLCTQKSRMCPGLKVETVPSFLRFFKPIDLWAKNLNIFYICCLNAIALNSFDSFFGNTKHKIFMSTYVIFLLPCRNL